MLEVAKMAKISCACPKCYQVTPIHIVPADWTMWQRGELIQVAFPYLNVGEREMLKTGYCPKCWDEIFSE